MRVLITGGAGFVGTNLAAALLARGARVTVLDNLDRAGSERNLAWLQGLPHRGRLTFTAGDVRDAEIVSTAAVGSDVVVHLAAQVAVTTSVEHPRLDFDVNALGTVNVLEAARLARRPPAVLFASTNKVYGGMEDVAVVERATRYEYADRPDGIGEDEPLDFHSPYGCSKGAADQYVRDYARIYGLRTLVFRMSCVYGPHQFGNEDQGWVAHFAISSLTRRSVTVFGDGKQARDVLYVGDAVKAYLAAIERIDELAGQVLNLGGGPSNVLSLVELLELLEDRGGRAVRVGFSDWRPGDQRVYVSDVRKAEQLLAWRPSTSPRDGVEALLAWHEARAPEALAS